jgi:hydroxyquinol 1,2-dioxygenase
VRNGPTRDLDEISITSEVLSRNGADANRRLVEIMKGLVTHLHGFARDVELTEAEWVAGIEFLTAVGHMTDDKRQEFILLSDTLGLSMLVIALNNRKPAGCTESTVFGPFFVEDAPEYRNGDDVSNGASGEPCFVTGRIRGLDGEPVANALIDVWQADAEGLYDVQRPGDIHRGRGRLKSGSDGSFHFQSIVAEAYPIPHDGPVGTMLKALGREPYRPAHLHFMIAAEGYEKLVTHVFRQGSRYLDSDAVFGVRQSLIADWKLHPAGPAPDGTVLKTPYCTLDFSFVLNPSTKGDAT